MFQDKSMTSVFTKIVNREIPAYIVAEDELHIAFLDINPLAAGHILVIPKKEVDYLFDLNEDEYVLLHSFAFRVARAIKPNVSCKRIGVAVLGLEVPHAHIHLIPINSEKDLNFSNPRKKLSENQMNELTAKIRSTFEGNLNSTF
jgi:histidine triad (HIT) family protein